MKKITCLLLLTISFSLSAQKGKADKYFKFQNFEYALDEYLELIEEAPENPLYNYRVGVCFLNTNGDKSEAIPYLENVVTHSEEINPNAVYLLGRAYHFGYRFDDAIKQYNVYKDLNKGSDLNLEDVDRQIQHCVNAKLLMTNPVELWKNQHCG